MFHSYLIIDTGTNPDKLRPGRTWLNNIYAVHQRLCMGFPNEEHLINDPFFLSPFNPDGFTLDTKPPYKPIKGEKPLAKKESNRPNFLFRIDNQILKNQRISVIGIQSELKPNWEYAFRNARYLLADVPIAEPKQYNPNFQNGDNFIFRININLSKKNSKYDKNGNERPLQDRKKRVSFIWNKNKDETTNNPKEIRDSDIRNWFENKTNNYGFTVKDFRVVKLGWILGWKHTENTSRPSTLRFRSALLEGSLQINNKEQFHETIKQGIGSAKAFGFGLLSVKKIDN